MDIIVIPYTDSYGEKHRIKFRSDISEIKLAETHAIELDISSLDKCTNLQSLEIDRNKYLEHLNLTPISACPDLQILKINHNPELRKLDLTPVSSCTRIKKFEMIGNRRLKSLDVSPLLTCKELISLTLVYNGSRHYIDITPLLNFSPEINIQQRTCSLLEGGTIKREYPQWIRYFMHSGMMSIPYNEATIRHVFPMIEKHEPESIYISFLIHCLAREYGLGGLGVIDCSLEELKYLLEIEPSKIERELIRIYCKQIDRGGTTIQANIEKLSTYHRNLASRIEAINSLREMEIKQIVLEKMWGGEIDVKPLLFTAWGFRICTALELGTYCKDDSFDRVRKSIEQLGGSIDIQEDVKLSFPKHISNNLCNYILRLVENKYIREKLRTE
ncbi:MAG: hypothetical protein GF411_20430 [Candidatus Lokiarchaeota archaeon]|nr:hypothetical protein [Candidatus Lokiarchaeota archaeon]